VEATVSSFAGAAVELAADNLASVEAFMYYSMSTALHRCLEITLAFETHEKKTEKPKIRNM
jgi:hypothetical protein